MELRASLYRIIIVLTILGVYDTYAQTTIWSEDFSTNSNDDITGDDNNSPSGSDWTTSCATCNRPSEFRVESGEFRVENTDEIATWTSETIDISGYTNVTITVDVDMDDNQFDATDCITLYYNLDGGGNTQFTTNGNLCDDGSDPTVASQTGLSGSTLVLEFDAITTNTNEDLHFDNILVTGILPLGKDGPAGVGDTDGSGAMVLWLDANQGVTTTSSAVTEWADQSGYSNDCTPPAASNRPSLVDPGTNSHPIITFDGSNDYLTASDDNSLDLTTWSIVVVGIVNTHKNYNAFVVKGSDASENYEFLTNFPSTGNFHYPVLHTTAARSTDSESGETMSNSVYGIYQLDYDQSNFEMHINGDHTETDSETRTPQTNSSSLYIANEQGTSGRNANASLGEVIIYNTPLNTAQRYILHNAMAAKYGFSMDANSLYDEDDSGYDFDVAGIGQAGDGSSHDDAQGTGIVRVQSPSGLGNSEFLIWGHDNAALSSWGVTDLPAGIQSRLARDWSASETGEVGTVTISFDLSSVAGSITASDLRLLVDGDGTYASGATTHSGATDLGSDVYQWTGIDIDNNEHFTVGSINSSQTPLPIELLSFTATALDESVQLDWQTASETNNDFFTLERSTNAAHWEAFMTMDGAGNSNDLLSYRAHDRSPHTGLSYYRLKQTDYDGQYSYSEARSVEIQAHEPPKTQVFPVPTDGLVTVLTNRVGDLDHVMVFNSQGQNITNSLEFKRDGSTRMTIDFTHLSPGLYFVKTKTTVNKVYKQ